MNLLIDSGFLYATLDKSDRHHERAKDVISSLSSEIIILPTIVLVEVSYLLGARIGHHAIQTFVAQMKESPLEFVCIQQLDLVRIHELLQIYANVELDFVDASITALAERLDIKRILTVDARDFRIIRPRHCDYFDILP